MAAPAPARPVPRLKTRYLEELRGRLQSELSLGNVMQVPRLDKVVVNCGVGRATQQSSLLDGAVNDLTVITGQKPAEHRQALRSRGRPTGQRLQDLSDLHGAPTG